MHMVRTLAVTLLLALPQMAIADTRTAYHCEGDQTTEGGIGETASTTKEHVVQDYAVDLEAGRYWDWKEQTARPERFELPTLRFEASKSRILLIPAFSLSC